LLRKKAEGGGSGRIVLESIKEYHEELSMFGLPPILQLFAHLRHTFLINNQNIKIMHHIEDKPLILKSFNYLRAYTFTKFVCLQDK
jgi:hypothetical protein